jgi:hypothetical protein
MPEHFFIVGAQRSGTSYLYQRLADHPDIEMALPIRPEPKFFLLDQLYEQGLEYYYRSFFSGGGTASLMGEKSTSYIEFEKVPQRIMQHLPGAKIVMCLRDPIQRAISNYWFSANNGLETLPLEQAFYQEQSRREDYDHTRISASPYAYLQRGHYIRYIETYEKYVPREQIKLLIYERLTSDPGAIQELLDFLGVASQEMPLLHAEQVVNPSEKATTVISDALRRYLRQHFADSNQRLADYLKLDLAQWWSL